LSSSRVPYEAEGAGEVNGVNGLNGARNRGRLAGLPRRGSGRTRSPGLALAITLSAQLMIILDMTVVNIALPRIQGSLHFTPASLSWVLNGYTLTSGGLLLLGGRAGDILGRRRMFIIGIGLFTRTRALAIYMGVITGGSSLGLVLGGVITEWLSWRWVLFINVPIGVAVVAVAPLFVPETTRLPGRFDLAGALTATAGVTALVYGFIRAATDGWGDHLGLVAFGAAAVLIALFVVTETRARQPITPLRLFADMSRSGSFIARLFLIAGMFGVFFFLTQFLQKIMGFSPLRAGVAFLPMTLALFASSRLAPRLMPRLGAKPLMIAGLLPAIAGLAWLSRVSVASAYWPGIFGPMMLLGLGLGLVFVPLTTTSLAGVPAADSGAASGLVNMLQLVGGALGLGLLVAVYGTATRHAASHPLPGLGAAAQAQHVLAHGIATAFGVAALLDLASLLVIVALIRTRKPRPDLAPARHEHEEAVAS
jgi:predicted MFS family arabinose efflux permease